MSYGTWNREIVHKTRGVSEKAYERQSLPAWEAKWHALSVQARYFFLNEVKGPTNTQTVYSQQPSVSVDKFPPHILEELKGAGFVAVAVARSRSFTDRVVACKGLYDFATRLRSSRRFHLLAGDLPSEVQKYVDVTFYGSVLVEIVAGVLRKAGIEDYPRLDEALARYVTHRHWPGWVAESLKDPIAERVLDVFREAEGSLPLAEVAGRLDDVEPARVRAAVDSLVVHLALVEDLRPQTWELMVGFLPAVREEIRRASQPRRRPLLVVVEQPREVGPDGSAIVNDLRALLLEVVSEPPRVRQDRALFHKETERFAASLERLPTWLLQALKWTDEVRLREAQTWARALGLVKEVSEGKETRIRLTSKGERWLSGGLDEQYTAVYGLLITPAADHEPYDPDQVCFFTGLSPFGGLLPGDTRFLGEPVAVTKVGEGKRSPYDWEAKPEDYQALRNALYQALTALEPGTFYRLDSVLSHLAFAEHNPLNRGLSRDQAAVYWGSRAVPPLDEQREEAARRLLDIFVRRRLVPLGCVRTAIDGEGRIAVARQARCDAYFGREVAPSDLAPAATPTARVVVQPDFSVMVIGMNPVPAAELAPFCERTTRGGSQGAMVLKITRPSVVKAVTQGLEPAEILAWLQRHASNEVPTNVLREVGEWSQWVRQITASTQTVLRCPDRDTADRVTGALKRQAERITDTLVALDRTRLTATERTKLRSHGIIVQGRSEVPESKAKTRRSR
jgi:hypothetical protein